ncbi:diphthine methyl ester synthase isoform X2 [Nematostella vectensis]|uniref:diphthine methyl ester synthase isoform X2 n=1 Tax=Nematostella vectensis TaxID=45351 RepID=UPI00138FE930|nr:diphthine methyl ester synthase isoform X2 [Nematostella vectensis]
MLYLIGLGLGDAKDITVKGLEVVKKAKKVFLEAYTSILGVNKEELEKLYGRDVILADRDLVEQQSEIILENAKTEDIAFLVVGDPFGATTHTDLVIRARQENIPYKVFHNASIMNAIGCCGLQLYNYGEAVSICFWTESWKPDSFYDKIAANRKRGLHSLCLLDIKVKEQSVENLMSLHRGHSSSWASTNWLRHSADYLWAHEIFGGLRSWWPAPLTCHPRRNAFS